MQIVADENIPLVREAFGQLGQVRLMPGREITYSAVRYADMLLVRSVTPVNEALVKKTRLRMIATATAGCDHVDQDALKAANIAFASAPGCNAIPVAEYVIAAIILHAERLQRPLAGMTVGIIGCGQVGSALASRLESLDIQVLRNDPPRAANDEQGGPYVSLKEAMQADVVTLHVPLTADVEHATRRMIGLPELAKLRPNTLFINTSRGEVVDEQALLTATTNRKDIGLVLDVWSKEPYIDINLAKRADIATPHIAGYSYDAKLRGTDQIFQACREFLGAECRWSYRDHLPESEHGELKLETQNEDEALRQAVLTVYDPRRDDQQLRSSFSLLTPQRGALFDALRKNYPQRREFESLKIANRELEPGLRRKLEGLGFRLELEPQPQDEEPAEEQ